MRRHIGRLLRDIHLFPRRAEDRAADPALRIVRGLPVHASSLESVAPQWHLVGIIADGPRRLLSG